MSFGVIFVVNRSSRVWRSRSPLMLPEVSAGMINIKSRNSRVATKAYSWRKLEYWTVAEIRTWATAEYILRSATTARIPLKTMMIKGILKLLARTVTSLL